MSIMPPIRKTITPITRRRAKMSPAPARVTRKPIVLMMLGCTRRRTRASTAGFNRRTKPLLNHSGMNCRALEVRFDHLGEALLANSPDDGLDDLPLLEEQHARYRADRVTLSR